VAKWLEFTIDVAQFGDGDVTNDNNATYCILIPTTTMGTFGIEAIIMEI